MHAAAYQVGCCAPTAFPAQALSDFKRTHEQASLLELRAMMSSDDYEALQQCTSSASYFC